MLKKIILMFLFMTLMNTLVNAEKNVAISSIKEGEYRGAKTATHPTWFKESFLDLDEDVGDATNAGKRLALYFWQPGCP
ncbi:MAG: thioredoxin, partial [Cocleimonas sp.]